MTSCFFIYFLVKKRIRCLNFELRTVLLITVYQLSYILEYWIEYYNEYISSTDKEYEWSVFMKDVTYPCFNYVSWLFASQYLMTCILIPSFIKARKELIKMYDGKSEYEYNMQPLYGQFTQRQSQSYEVIEKEKQRQMCVHRGFLATSIGMFIAIFGCHTYLSYVTWSQ